MRIRLVLLFLLFIFTARIHAAVNELAFSATSVLNLPSSNYSDLYIGHKYSDSTGVFSWGNRMFAGLSQGATYVQDSLYMELGNQSLNVGYKKSLLSGDKLGGYDKYSYPPLKELDTIFLLDDFAYRDSLADQKNSLELKGYIPIDTIYFNSYWDDCLFRVRTFSIVKGNVFNGASYKPLSFFREFTIETSKKINDITYGFYFIPGQMNDYYYKNVYSLSSNPGIGQYKDVYVYGLRSGGFTFNVGFFDRAVLQFITTQTSVDLRTEKLVFYTFSDMLDKSHSLFISQNYSREYYIYYNYSKLIQPNYFLGYSDRFLLNDLQFHYLITYKNTQYNSIRYNGLVYNIGCGFSFSGGEYDLSIGTSAYKSVWNGWSVLPARSQDIVLRLDYKHFF